MTVPDIGARLREVRQARGWTQLKMAGILQVERTYLSRLESSEFHPSWGKLERFCEVLGVSMELLLGGAEFCLLDDPFIREAQEDLLNLTFAQRATVIKVLQELREDKKIV